MTAHNRATGPALVDPPGRERQGGVDTCAAANLDLHDLARRARSYGAERRFGLTLATGL